MDSSFPKALIFDWDNTLVDSWGPIAAAMNLTRAHFGLETWTLEKVKAVCTRSARESFPEWFGERWKEAYDFYYAGFDAERRKRDITVLRGAGELLRWLKAESIPTFVVSNKRGDYLRHEADKLGWTNLFVAIAGAQDAPRDKPAREHVEFALAQGDLTGEPSIWFAGDSETDMICAKNSSCTPVHIGPAVDAARFSVALTFSDCQELQSLLYNRSKKKVG